MPRSLDQRGCWSEEIRKKRDLNLDMDFGSGKYLSLSRNVR
jgi:hypothetical protein